MLEYFNIESIKVSK